MSKTMKAAVVRAFGEPLRIEEVPVPEVQPGMIQVAIQASGVCHTDLHAAEGDWPVKPEPPFIPGHEGVGFVSAVGKGVTHVKEGDRVGVPWLYTACGHCTHCLGGWETLCESQLNTCYSVNGGFADYVLADPNYVGHLPDNVGFKRRRACGVFVDNGDTQLAHGAEGVGVGVEFDGGNLFAHFMQFERDTIAEMSQPDEDDVIFQSGCDGHFPFLVARAAIEEQAAKIGQSLREHDDADDRH